MVKEFTPIVDRREDRLTAEENKLLVESGRCDQLMESNYSLIYWMACKQYSRSDKSISFDDIFQEIAYKTFEKSHLFNPEKGAVSTYFYRVATNRLLNIRKSYQRVVFYPNKCKNHAEYDHHTKSVDESHSSDPVENASLSEMSERLRIAILKLSHRQRYIIYNRYVKNETLDKIRKTLGISRERVRQIQVESEKKLASLI